MSHPYSGAASYIYANEYQPPPPRINQVPPQKLYNYYRYAPEENLAIDLRVKNTRSDHGDHSFDPQARARRRPVAPAPARRPKTAPTQLASPSSELPPLPSNFGTTTISSTAAASSQTYSPHPYSHPTILPISPTSPYPAKSNNNTPRLPLKLKLTLPKPFQPPRSPTPSPIHLRPPRISNPNSSSWRWSTLSGTKFRISAWFPGLRRRSSSKSKATNPGPMIGSSFMGSQSQRSKTDTRHGPTRSLSQRPPTGEKTSADTKRGKSLRFAVGKGARAERNLDFSMVSA